MWNRSSQPARSTRQPFRLLDLPRELLVPILRSYRYPIPEHGGLVIYFGEQEKNRFEVLRDLCLTHRDVLPFAQEELFMRITIESNERMDMLNRSIASSQRCKEYAGRVESIYLGFHVDTGKLMDSGAFNPRELSSYSTMKFSALNRFQNLRRVHLFEAKFDEALALPNLETCSSVRSSAISIDVEAAFTSVNLPNLRRLIISNHCAEPVNVGKHFDSIIPQLDHLNLSRVDETDLEYLLLLSKSLQSLRCCYQGSEYGGLGKGFDQIRRIDIKELHFIWTIERESSYNWETDFEAIAKFKRVMGGKDELERVALELSLEYESRPSSDVCNRVLARWKGIKDELNSIGVKNGIEVVTVSCSFSCGYTNMWKE